MTRKTDKYAQFADHPRYGRRPNVSGLNPSPMDRNVRLHWNATSHKEIVSQYQAVVGKEWPYGDCSEYCDRTRRIPNTAITADLSRQTPATVSVTHYFDLERQCRDCSRPFIFFAEEQRYWYEELGFGLESDCVRCADCRKRQQGIARHRETYESLFHVANKTDKQTLEMADACLWLIEQDVFTTRQTERVRMLLNSIPEDADIRKRTRCSDLFSRVLAAEADRGEAG
ncbi:MAG: zinc-ribbon domain containing protein [Planctomycetota bacterium]